MPKLCKFAIHPDDTNSREYFKLNTFTSIYISHKIAITDVCTNFLRFSPRKSVQIPRFKRTSNMSHKSDTAPTIFPQIRQFPQKPLHNFAVIVVCFPAVHTHSTLIYLPRAEKSPQNIVLLHRKH